MNRPAGIPARPLTPRAKRPWPGWTLNAPLVGLLLLLLLPACNETGTGSEGTRSLFDVAIEAEEYDIFLGAAVTVGILPALEQGGPLTVLGIPNEAFQRLPSSARSRILNNPTLLGPIVAHHLISGTRTAGDLAAVASVVTLAGIPLSTRVENGVVEVGGARIVLGDLEAWNGIFHGVDRVLFPEVVLNMVERIQVDDDFQTLESALGASGVIDELRFGGPFTLFAPTDAAFEALPDEARQELLGDPEVLARVLLHHVVQGTLLRASLLPVDALPTLAETSLEVTPSGSTVRVGGAALVRPDLRTTNGVIHGIDRILLPPDVVLPGVGGARADERSDPRP